MPRWAAALVCAAWALMLPGRAALTQAHAQPDDTPGTALIVRVPGDERIVNPLRAELSSYRFHVLELADRVATRNTRLTDLADQYSAEAAVRALPEATSVELCVVAPQTAGSTTATESEVVNAGPTRDPAVLAVRITEVMRARGLRLKLAEPEVSPATTTRDDARDTSAGAPTAGPDSAPARTTASDVTQTAGAAAPPRATGAPPSAASAPARATAPRPAPPTAAAPTRETTRLPPAVVAPAEAAGRGAAARTASPAARANARSTSFDDAADQVREAHDDSDEVTDEVETTSETATADSAADDDAEPDDVAAEPDEPTRPAGRSLWQAELAAAVVLSPGGADDHGLAPSWDIFGQLSIRPLPFVSASVFGLFPVSQAPLERQLGEVTIRTYMIGVFGDLHARTAKHFALSFGLGGAGLLTSVNGKPAEGVPYSEHSESLRTPAVLARTGLTWDATSLVHFTARGLVGIALPAALKVQVTDPDPTAASWGQPFVVLTLGCELAPTWP